ncbi:radial spoke head protein 6 homolog A-like [Argonauta hians]
MSQEEEGIEEYEMEGRGENEDPNEQENDDGTMKQPTDNEPVIENEAPSRSSFQIRDSQINLDMVFNPKEEVELRSAKAFLMTASSKTGDNLYDHLCDVITGIISERYEDAVDTFEIISTKVKKFKLEPIIDTLQDMADPSPEVALAKLETIQLQRREEESEDREEEVESPLPNIMENSFYFEQCCVGLGKEELFRVWLAMKHLVDNNPVQNVRFWGKIFGLEQNYYVVEADFREGEQVEEEAEDEAEQEVMESMKDVDEMEEEEVVDEDKVPQIDYKPPQPVPKEEKGTGTNKKTFFVCNEPGRPWSRLPLVTPAQITVARQVRKYFTGRLDAPIITYPPFPGNETNYLRAQIARISAGTQVSITGFYQFDDEEEEEEEGEVRENFIENIDFEGITVKELCESLTNWAHHTMHILPQGRCRWLNTLIKTEEEMEEGLEEEREDAEEPQPETGPPLLTPLSEDISVSGILPWSTEASSNLIPQFAIAALFSNLWPGACTYATNRKFENIYIGWGHKALGDNYTPTLVMPPQTEYVEGPEVTEVDDPTPEQEAALRAEQQANAAAEEELEEEEEEEEEEGN